MLSINLIKDILKFIDFHELMEDIYICARDIISLLLEHFVMHMCYSDRRSRVTLAVSQCEVASDGP